MGTRFNDGCLRAVRCCDPEKLDWREIRITVVRRESEGGGLHMHTIDRASCGEEAQSMEGL